MANTLGKFRSICEAQGVGLAYAFGSAALHADAILRGIEQGPLDPMQDLDLGLVFATPLCQIRRPPHEIYSEIHSALSDLFTPLPLDLVLLEETHSILQSEAIAGVCLFAVSEDFRSEYELGVLRRAADFRYHFEQYHLERREALR